MYTKTIALVLALMLGVALVGCSSAEETPDAETPDVEAPGDDTGDAAGPVGSDVPSDTRPANGLYDQGDGTVIALGTLEWIDLEGGFYALTGAPGVEGNIAVIQNADEFADELEALKGSDVIVTGALFDGASIRMAGPEVVITSIDGIGAQGAAE
ncbi:MAG: hypothetical protein JW733_04790 [Coriobacteriia bacterium]|nr:hypothetical protein [Coriobacteriia bacterium]MBN2847418.1 hypothetical protein [Coriobacteriia bacterium]